MVGLTPQIVKSVSLTKQEGEPILLDGNRLYFRYKVRGAHGRETEKWGFVDLTISRKTFTPVEFHEVPSWPQKVEVKVNVHEVAFGLWWIAYAGSSHRQLTQGEEYLPVRHQRDSRVIAKDRKQVTVDDFTDAATQNWSCAMDKGQSVRPSYWWGISEELMEEAKRIAKEREADLDRQVNSDWTPMRVLGPEETAFVLGIFNFDGDKKSLVTALKSWGAEIKDGEVSIDKLGFTGRIKLATTVEELIP